MKKPICVLRSVNPDGPQLSFNDWAIHVYVEIRKHYKPLNNTRHANTLEKTH